MKRIIYMVLMNLLHAPIWFFTISRMAREEDTRTAAEKYGYISEMVKRINRRGRVTVTATGTEHIPSQDGFILFPNHQGLFDMLALFSTCPRPLSVVIKKEASNWILVKQVLGATKSLAMDRDDIKDQVRIITEVTNGEVYLTSVDTGGVDWMWLAMAENGEDWTGGPDGTVNVQLDSVKEMLTMQQNWLNDGIAMVSTDGHVDLEAGFSNIMEGKIASFPKAMWYMSRFKDYMPEMEGKYDITTCPVFEEGQKCSVGIGGTGTVVTNQCENPELAAEWLAWAKCSEEGENLIWNELGFDVCNTALWSDEDFAYDESNTYNTFFRVKPYEVLNELAENDAIGTIYTTKNSPTLNDYMCTTTLNNVLEDGMDVDEALQDAQDYLDFECE